MTTIQFFTESTGYFMQILDSLVKHMVSSVEVCRTVQYRFSFFSFNFYQFTSQDQQVVDSDNAHLAFQEEMIACLGNPIDVVYVI
jgi:hypothetical protein